MGFYVYVVSNVLWTTWGWYTGAWALIALQVALFLMNLRGVWKNTDEESKGAENKGAENKSAEGSTAKA